MDQNILSYLTLGTLISKLLLWITALVPLSSAIAVGSVNNTYGMSSIEHLGEFLLLHDNRFMI